MTDGEIETGVPHLPHIDDGRRGKTGRPWQPWVEEQVVSHTPIYVDDYVELPVEESEIRTHVRGYVLLPLEVRVTDRGLSETRLEGVVVSTDIVVRVAAAAAEARNDSSRWDRLVSGYTPAKPQHGVGQESVTGHERLVRYSPAETKCGERAPTVGLAESRRSIFAERSAGNVPVGEVVIHFSKERQQRVPAAGARDVFCIGVAERILDVAGIDIRYEEIVERRGEEAVVTGSRLVTQQQVEIVAREAADEPCGVGPDPIRGVVLVLEDRVGKRGLGVLWIGSGEAREHAL